MTNYKNNLPLYAEELILNEEAISLQQILNQFKQPIPDKFVELNQLNWMCFTQGWKEPTCERYNCLINGEWKQVDISHALLEELGLEKAKNISYSVHISSTVINKGLDRYFAYNVKEEKDIFLQKPFTIQNLDKDLTKLFEHIKKLEGENKEQKEKLNQKEERIKELEAELNKELSWWDKWLNDNHELFTIDSNQYIYIHWNSTHWGFFESYKGTQPINFNPHDSNSKTDFISGHLFKQYLKRETYQRYRDK